MTPLPWQPFLVGKGTLLTSPPAILTNCTFGPFRQGMVALVPTYRYGKNGKATKHLLKKYLILNLTLTFPNDLDLGTPRSRNHQTGPTRNYM